LLPCAIWANESIDLEEHIQEFVLETRRIEVPGYPDAFNASIIRWRGSLLMSFRIIPDRASSFTSLLGLIALNDDFSPRGEPQILKMRTEKDVSPSRAEDARLVSVGDHLYIIYADNMEPKISRGGFRVYVAELIYDGHSFEMASREKLSRFEGMCPQKREKSWVPFDYQGNLFLAYSLDPHLIFHPLLDGSGECETIASSSPAIDWDYGLLRGGTPATMVDGKYLAFFHSVKEMQTVHSDNHRSLHYFIGAYTFQPEPPFHLLQMSPEPIIAKGFYHNTGFRPYWHPVRAIFPCGYLVEDDVIWVVYGREDHEIWAMKLDKAGLFRSLR